MSPLGSFATGSSQQQIRRCRLCPESGSNVRIQVGAYDDCVRLEVFLPWLLARLVEQFSR
jgi:hypothetical protein